MWLCTAWVTDWNAVSAVSTLSAVIVALGFGIREAVARHFDRRIQRAFVSTALLHGVSFARQQVLYNVESMAPETLEAHRARLNEYGRALRVQGANEMARHAGSVAVLGREAASDLGYALGLLEESNRFFEWLTELNEMNDGGWRTLQGQFAVRAEALRQAAACLRALELALFKHVPQRILELRLGPTWREYFDPAAPDPVMVARQATPQVPVP